METSLHHTIYSNFYTSSEHTAQVLSLLEHLSCYHDMAFTHFEVVFESHASLFIATGIAM